MKNLFILCFIFFLWSCKKNEISANISLNNDKIKKSSNVYLKNKSDSIILNKDTTNYFIKTPASSVQNINTLLKREQNSLNLPINLLRLKDSDLVRYSDDKIIVNNLLFPKKVTKGISYKFEKPFCNLYDLYYDSQKDTDYVIKNIEYIFSKKTNLNRDFIRYFESCGAYLLVNNNRITMYKGFFGTCDKNSMFNDSEFLKEYHAVYLLYFTQDEFTHEDIPYIKKIK